MTATKRRGPYARSAQTRASLAEAALTLVLESGHRNLTTSEVCARAGVSETARFYHYSTRDHLLVAALELADDRAAAQYTVPGSAAAGLEEVAGWIAGDAMDGNRAVVLLFTALMAEAPNPDHPAHGYFKRHNARGVAEFAEAVRHRQQVGLAHPDLDPETVGRQLQGIWRGLQTQWLVDQNFDLADEISQAFKRLTGQTVMETRQAIDQLMSTI